MSARRKAAKYSYVARRAAAARGASDTPVEDGGYDSDGDFSAYGATPVAQGPGAGQQLGTPSPLPRPARVRFSLSAGGGTGGGAGTPAPSGPCPIPQRHFSMVDLELQGRDVARAVLLLSGLPLPAPASAIPTVAPSAPPCVAAAAVAAGGEGQDAGGEASSAGSNATSSMAMATACAVVGGGASGPAPGARPLSVDTSGGALGILGELAVSELLHEAQEALELPDNDDSGNGGG